MYIIHIDSCHWSFRCFYFAKYKNIPAWIRTSPEVRCIFTCFKLKFQTFWNKREDFFKLFMGIGDAHKTNFILINRCIQSKLLFSHFMVDIILWPENFSGFAYSPLALVFLPEFYLLQNYLTLFLIMQL